MAINYVIDDSVLGVPQINVASDTTQRMALGKVISAQDATYGEGDFLYVKFTGTVVAGDFVQVDRYNKTCVQASTSTLVKGALMGVAMAAQANGTYGYVMNRGVHDAANVTTAVASGAGLALSATPGRTVASGGAGIRIDGVSTRALAASNLAPVELDWASFNANT